MNKTNHWQEAIYLAPAILGPVYSLYDLYELAIQLGGV